MQAILNALAYIDMIKVGLLSIQDFLKQEEMDLSHVDAQENSSRDIAISIKGGSFYWDSDKSQAEESEARRKEREERKFELKGVDLDISRGELVTLIGTYGSGKTSLANCILGEMRKKGNPKIRTNGTVAYASQVAWIMNDTIRNNILFGKDYNAKRYAEAIKYASLEPDLHLFAQGDL